jgi:hypothetical protein
MRNIKWLVLLAAVLVLASLGCERKITGNVELADNSSNNCFGCHNGTNDLGTEVVLATRQWENSKHGSGEHIETGSSCRGCHTTEGFIVRITGEDITSGAYNAVGCFACHNPHENRDFRLRTTDAVELGNGAIYDREESNICVQCHHGRRNVNTYVKDSVKMDNHFGPHHSNQSDMLLGENAYEYDNYNYDTNSWHSTGVADGCVKCHFAVSVGYQLGGHTFWMENEGEENVDACNVNGCHINDKTIDSLNRVVIDFNGDGNVDGVQDEVDQLVDELQTLLIDAGLLEWVQEENAWEPTDGLVVPDADSAGAVFNWSFVLEDKSHGIHNTRYAIAVLKSTINYMKTGDPNGASATKKPKMFSAH